MLFVTCLGKNSVNIDQFQLSRNTPGGEALSLIRVDDDLLESVLEEIRDIEGIPFVKLYCNWNRSLFETMLYLQII